MYEPDRASTVETVPSLQPGSQQDHAGRAIRRYGPRGDRRPDMQAAESNMSPFLELSCCAGTTGVHRQSPIPAASNAPLFPPPTDLMAFSAAVFIASGSGPPTTSTAASRSPGWLCSSARLPTRRGRSRRGGGAASAWGAAAAGAGAASASGAAAGAAWPAGALAGAATCPSSAAAGPGAGAGASAGLAAPSSRVSE